MAARVLVTGSFFVVNFLIVAFLAMRRVYFLYCNGME